MNKNIIGKTKDGKDIISYTIQNSKGTKAIILNLGCVLKELYISNNKGSLIDAVLGFEDVNDYETNGPGFGACVLPNCNRIGDAKFELNGKVYELEKNDGQNNLHSGSNPMHHWIWELVELTENSVTQKCTKADGACGFPGNLTVTMTYSLSEDDSLRLDYSATTDQDTVFNPTNHTYFNLSGHNSGSTLDNIVWIDADSITATDNTSIPHGEIQHVANTAFDFNTEKPVGKDINDPTSESLTRCHGYDINYCLNNPSLTTPVAYLQDEKSGLKMEVFTDMPGLQIYVGNFLGASDVGKGNNPYKPYDGICFESQYFPNSINVPAFPQPVIKASEQITHSTIYKFSRI